jgi:hypothetical protein
MELRILSDSDLEAEATAAEDAAEEEKREQRARLDREELARLSAEALASRPACNCGSDRCSCNVVGPLRFPSMYLIQSLGPYDDRRQETQSLGPYDDRRYDDRRQETTNSTVDQLIRYFEGHNHDDDQTTASETRAGETTVSESTTTLWQLMSMLMFISMVMLSVFVSTSTLWQLMSMLMLFYWHLPWADVERITALLWVLAKMSFFILAACAICHMIHWVHRTIYLVHALSAPQQVLCVFVLRPCLCVVHILWEVHKWRSGGV